MKKPKTNIQPNMSINKLAEYVVSKPARQMRLIKDQKFPKPFISAHYKDAREAISLFIAGNMTNETILSNCFERLGSKPVNTSYQSRQADGNMRAIETFISIMDDLDLQGATPRLGEHAPPKLHMCGVDISVKPDIILSKMSRGRNLIGGIKLHFPESNPLNEEACNYVSAAMQLYCEQHLQDEGDPHPQYNFVIEIPTRTISTGVTSTAKRKKDLEAACEQIKQLWKSIQE
jgi:hypothetical protein